MQKKTHTLHIKDVTKTIKVLCQLIYIGLPYFEMAVLKDDGMEVHYIGTEGSVWSDLNLDFCIGTQSAPTKFVQLQFSDIPCLLCKKSIEKTYLR